MRGGRRDAPAAAAARAAAARPAARARAPASPPAQVNPPPPEEVSLSYTFPAEHRTRFTLPPVKIGLNQNIG